MIIQGSHPTELVLPSDRELVLTRDFDAPRSLVFEAWSKPEHVRRWYGLRHLTLPVCEMDFREGGQWRFVMRDPKEGVDHGFSGEYREIVRSERIVYTERYERIPGSDHVVTLTLTDRDGKTTLREHILYQAKEHRDGHLISGMEAGMQETFARLDEFLASQPRRGA
jgi:uncharacterized protein YndB with AHSA1/START domain